MSLVAGQTNGTVDYYPTRGNATYDPELNGGSMTSMTVYDTDGTTQLATTTSVVKVTDGHYRFTFATAIASPGDYPVTTVWEATGSGPTVVDTTDTVRVEAFGGDLGSPVTVADVKTRLNKTLTVDDAEIEAMIDAAVAEYEQWVGPVSGTRTDVLDGGGTSLLLSTANPATLVSLTYADGTVIDTADVTLDTTTGLVFWNYGTAGRFSGGSRFVTVQYTVGPVPANHREAIIADVAGYFEATQAGPVGPDEGYGFGSRTTPLVLFPRIRALAVPSIA